MLLQDLLIKIPFLFTFFYYFVPYKLKFLFFHIYSIIFFKRHQNQYMPNIFSNLKEALGNEKSEAEIELIAKRNLGLLMKKEAEFCLNFSRKIGQKDKRIIFEFENLKQTVKINKGVIIAPLHLTEFFWAWPYWIASQGYKVQVVTNEPFAKERLMVIREELDDEKENKSGWYNIEIIQVTPLILQSCRNFLKEGGIVIIYPEFQEGKKKHIIEFLGIPIYVGLGIIELSLNIGAPILLSWVIKKNTTVIARIDKPTELILTGDKKEDIEVNIKQVFKIIESHIQKEPEEWYLWKEIHRLRAIEK
ncbi:MAG: hypothetical protein AB1414_00785 [bacterium]